MDRDSEIEEEEEVELREKRRKVSETSDSGEVKLLLDSWDVGNLYNKFKEFGIVELKHIRNLENDDLIRIVATDNSLYGSMILFRSSLKDWKENLPIDVHEIILRDGKEILAHSRDHRALTDPLRNQLIDIILKEVFARNLSLRRRNFEQLAEQILKILPEEEASDYYEKTKGNEPRGLLPQKYYAMLDAKKKRKKPAINQTPEDDLDTLLNDDVQKSIEFFTTSVDCPSDGASSSQMYDANDAKMISGHWEKTHEYRMKQIKLKTVEEFIELWPILKKSYGSQLIELDFYQMYGEDAAMSLLTNWESFFDNNLNSIYNMIKNKRTVKQLMNFEDSDGDGDADNNKKNVSLALALHDLLPPSTTKMKERCKPTISDSKNSFLKVISTSSNIKDEMKVIAKLCDLKQTNYYPMIFAVAEGVDKKNDSFDKIIRFVVVFRDIEYIFPSFLPALDATFIMYNILRIDYPPPCSKVWTFLNEVFYKLKTQSSVCPRVKSIVKSFT